MAPLVALTLVVGAGAAFAAQAVVADAQSAAELAEERLAATSAQFAVDLAGAALEASIDTSLAHTAAQAAAETSASALAAGMARRAAGVSEQVYAFYELRQPVPAEGWQAMAAAWAISGDELRRYNPDVDLDATEPGAELIVYRYDPDAPPVSRGRANMGRLYHGAPMPPGQAWIVRRHGYAWGTPDAISQLIRGLTSVADASPGTPVPMIGDISARYGGRLRPHRSHQSGRDADVAYYHLNAADSERFEVVRRTTLDVPRQWALFRYWISRGAAEFIFVDRRLIPELHAWAEQIGEDPEVIAWAFGDEHGSSHAIIRTSPGHDDHFHVRFVCSAGDDRCH